MSARPKMYLSRTREMVSGVRADNKKGPLLLAFSEAL